MSSPTFSELDPGLTFDDAHWTWDQWGRPTPILPIPAAVSLTTDRVTEYSVTIQNAAGVPIMDLDGLEAGQLEWSYATRLKAGGTMTVHDTGQNIDWLTSRVKVSVTVNGSPKRDVGTFIPSYAATGWSQGRRSWDLELHSLLLPLDQAAITGSLTLVNGDPVDLVIDSLIRSAGVIAPPVQNVAYAYPGGRVTWKPGISNLTIINDILDSMGFLSMTVSDSGVYLAERYVAPDHRPVTRTFEDGQNCIYVDEFTDEIDIFNIPNEILVIGKGDGDTEGPTATAVNDDPTDPYSTVNRTLVTKVYDQVEVASLSAAQTYAHARLVENGTPRRKFVIDHAPVELSVRNGAIFKSSTAGINVQCVVDKMSLPLDPLALQTTTLRAV